MNNIHLLEICKTYCGLDPQQPFTDYHTKIPADDIICPSKYTTFIDSNSLIFVNDFCVHLTHSDKMNAINTVNCPDCLREIKKSNFYCDIHRILSGREVTFEETCIYCGQNL